MRVIMDDNGNIISSEVIPIDELGGTLEETLNASVDDYLQKQQPQQSKAGINDSLAKDEYLKKRKSAFIKNTEDPAPEAAAPEVKNEKKLEVRQRTYDEDADEYFPVADDDEDEEFLDEPFIQTVRELEKFEPVQEISAAAL